MSIERDARTTIGRDLKDVQLRWPVSRPLVGALGKGLYEVRSTCNKVEYRVLFCIVDSTIVVLHGFKKKTQRTPQSDLNLARKRQQHVESDE